MAKAKLPKTEKVPFKWETWTNLGIQIILVLITVVSFCETQKSTKAAQESSESARESVAIQRQQYEDAKKQEGQKSLEESEKRKKDVELIEQQIAALKEQAGALNKGIKNTEVTQKPYLGVENLGFRLKYGNQLDSVFLGYDVKNDGIRPALLFSSTVYILDDKFRIAGKPHKTPANNTIITKSGFYQHINLSFDNQNCLICNINDILKLGDIYFCFQFEYYDPFLSENKLLTSKYFFYKWVKKDRNKLIFSGNDKLILYSTDLCTNKDEISKILEVVKANKI